MRSSHEGMARVFAVLLTVHGLIHLLGFAKAFRFAELPQLTQPISPLLGVLWLTSALLFLATAVCLVLWPRWWWAVGAVAVGVSMLAISQSWTDARAGALANLVILIGEVFGFLVQGPSFGRAWVDDRCSALIVPRPFLNFPARLIGSPIRPQSARAETCGHASAHGMTSQRRSCRSPSNGRRSRRSRTDGTSVARQKAYRCCVRAAR